MWKYPAPKSDENVCEAVAPVTSKIIPAYAHSLRRGYFGAAKQAKTREARIEKYADAIMDGMGLDD